MAQRTTRPMTRRRFPLLSTALTRVAAAMTATVTAAAMGLAAQGGLAAPAAADTVDPTGTAPIHEGFLSGYLSSIVHPGRMPAGVNDYSCTPSPAHPDPVVLIHGTWDNAEATWTKLVPMLREQGYCVFALNYGDESESGLGHLPGVYGTQALEKSGDEVAAFIDTVLVRTGAEKVDLIGHSQGGIHMRLYIQEHGGAEKVRTLIGLSPNNHGTTLSGIAAMGSIIDQMGVPILDAFGIPLGRAGVEQAVGAPIFDTLNRKGDTLPGISYTVIATQYDWNVSPYQSQYLAEVPGHDVTNIRLQDGCEQDHSEHLSIAYSPRALWYIMNALDPSYAEAHAKPCVHVAPFTGPGGTI